MGVRRRRGASNWANEISRDEVPRARCGRSAERRLREAGGGAAGGGYFWPCARYSCGAHARGFRKRSIRSLPQRRRVGNADHQSAKHFADSQTLAASIYGGQGSSIGCAAAGCGVVTPSFPQTKHPEALIYGRRMRVVPAAAGGCRPCRPSSLKRCVLPSAMPIGCGRQRDQGSLRCLSYACVAWPPAAASGTGPCPALTLSNAVPWVRSEKDTFRSSQLLVVGERRGAFN